MRLWRAEAGVGGKRRAARAGLRARALRGAVAQREGHAAAGAVRAGAVALDLLRHRGAHCGDEGGHLVGADRLPADTEVAEQHAADAFALVEPVGAVPAREGGEATVELDAPVVGLPVLAFAPGDR